jgi:hypothetical protein
MTGDQNDFLGRLLAALPRRWFPDDAPILSAVLSGLGSAWADLYSTLDYVQLQTRIATATDVWLDGAAADYLASFPRRLNEPDAAYSLRIRKEIIRPRNTRAAIVQVLQDLTGNTPTVFRPSNVADTGAWGVAMGYGVAGAYGSLDLPFQAFVTIERGTAPGGGSPVTEPGPLSGYGAPLGGWGVGALCYGDGSPAQGGVTDTDIYNAVASVTPDGHINWVQITGAPSLPGLLVLDQGHLDLDYLL